VRLITDFFDEAQPIDRTSLVGQVPVVYTGRVDRSFDYSAGELSWRTLDCELEVVAVGDYHGASVMSYADAVVRFTRTHEFRHYHPERDGYPADKTVILREFSRFATRDDEPYYPVNTADDRANLLAYRELQAGEKDVFFGGAPLPSSSTSTWRSARVCRCGTTGCPPVSAGTDHATGVESGQPLGFRVSTGKSRGHRVVPVVGLEPTRPFEQSILSAPRLPFRHTGA
jgi:hypothetical protein